MKNIHLKFQKEVISVLSGTELSKFWGGVKKIYSIDACITNEECNSVINCESQNESCQGKCLSDFACKGGSTEPIQHYLTDVIPVGRDSCGCKTYENCNTSDTTSGKRII